MAVKARSAEVLRSARSYLFGHGVAVTVRWVVLEHCRVWRGSAVQASSGMALSGMAGKVRQSGLVTVRLDEEWFAESSQGSHGSSRIVLAGLGVVCHGSLG